MLFPYFGMKCKSLSVIFEWLYIKKMGPTKGANNLRWITWLYYSVALFGLWHLVMHSIVNVRQKEMICKYLRSYTIFFTIIKFANFYQLKSCPVNNTIDTIEHSWCDGYFTSTKFLWDGRTRIGVKVFRRKFHTHIYLNYVRVK